MGAFEVLTLQKRQLAKRPSETLVFGTIAAMLSVIGCLAFLEIMRPVRGAVILAK